MTSTTPARTDTTAGADVHVDMVVVGDGLVGRPLAIALSSSGHRVALVDKAADGRATPAPDDPLDQRCTALSAGTVDWLRSRDLWYPQVASASPIRRVHVSHRGHFGATRLTAEDVGRDALGYTIENRCFIHSLQDRLDATGVMQLRGRVLGSIDEHDDGMVLGLIPADPVSRTGDGDTAVSGVDTVHARLLVVADGTGSTTAQLFGIGSRTIPHRQWATLTTVQVDREHADTARERFTATGPLALLPRPGKVLSVVACHDDEQARKVEGLDAPAFLGWLQAHMQESSGTPLAVGPRVLLPLGRTEADSQRRGRCVLVGNAARLLHPVAGQGYNLAVRDLASLVHALEGAADPGEDALLGAWLHSRQKDQAATVGMTDTLARLFRGRAALPGHLRAGGLLALDLSGPLRRRFAVSSTRGPLL